MSRNTEYYHKFYRKWVAIWEFVDIETGELIEKEKFKKEYIKIKQENSKKYGKEYGYNRYTVIGRRKQKQLDIWGHEQK